MSCRCAPVPEPFAEDFSISRGRWTHSVLLRAPAVLSFRVAPPHGPHVGVAWATSRVDAAAIQEVKAKLGPPSAC
eukprot:5320988-Pyramimonas_sp.AAC.1